MLLLKLTRPSSYKKHVNEKKQKAHPGTTAYCFLTFSLLFTSQNIFAYVDIPETGETQSIVTGDDADTLSGKSWPDQRFTDRHDGTIIDQVTGLMWLKDADCATESTSGATTPFWNDTFQFINNLNSGASNIHCDAYVKAYTDWRSPNVNEISSLMRAGLSSKTISNWLNIPDNNSGGFSQTNLVANPIWTSTTSAEDSDKAWIANLETGGIELANKINTNFSAHIFSAVRNSDLIVTTNVLQTGQTISHKNEDDGFWKKGATSPANTTRFIKTDTGTIVDKLTGLVWLADANCANPTGSDWANAIISTQALSDTPAFLVSCSSYTETDADALQSWRLPNINELKSLINYGEFNPAILPKHPFSITTEMPFWSSTSSNGAENTSSAWSVDFNSGQINASTNKTSLAYTWPVSGPIDFIDIGSDISDVSFGSFFISTTSDIKTITIKNSGTLPLSITSLTLSDTHFSIQTNTCESTTLERNTDCEINIKFTPSSTGEYNANLTIESDALGLSSYKISLTGKGIDTSEEESNPNCFIATAAYGSYLSNEVTLLRAFRDQFLLKTETGKNLVALYYETSPPIAELIQQNASLRFITRILLTPVIYAIKYPLIAIISLSILLIFLLSLLIKRLAHNETFCRVMRTK